MQKFDIAVIGGGPGGYVAAIKAAQLGFKTVIFEGHKIGGVCLNYGCIPTKTLLKTAKLFKEIKHASVFGISLGEPDAIGLDWDKMMHRKDKVVNQLTSGVATLLKHNQVTTVPDYAVAIDNHTLEAGGQTYKVDHMIIATGSSPAYPPVKGLDQGLKSGRVISSTEAISLAKHPDSLVVLGGGVIAVEFATLYSSLGTQVTLIQRSSEILSFLDKDIRQTMQKHLVKSGVKVITDTNLISIDDGLVTYEHQGKTQTASGDYILASFGRKPNLNSLQALNLKTNKAGIEVNEYLQTNVPNVYAIGDVNGKYMLAHVASAEGIAAVEHIKGNPYKINYNKIPSCIYSFPEVGVAGLTEEEAKEAGHDVVVSKFPISVNGKALAEGESVGFVKIVADKTYGEVLGIHIIAAHATDMIAEAVVTMELEGTIHDLARTVHPHPTLSEIVMEAAHGAVDRPIHLTKSL